jgi:hypothetical protein
MRTPPNKARKRFPRTLGLALLGVLAGLGVGAYAVLAAGGAPDFSIAASPQSQTVSQGRAAAYTVTVKRTNGFTGAVTLKASNLPGGATASWKLSDGRASNVLPAGLDRARLTIKTTSNTPSATSHPLITAKNGNGKLSHTATVTLVVKSASQPNFALGASPWTRTVLQGDQTSYGVSIARNGGFSGPVSLSATGLPAGATASWTPSHTVSGSSATLSIGTASSTPTGSYDFLIKGTGAVQGKTVSRLAAATLVVQKTVSFGIAGDLSTPLAPGSAAPLDLALTNPYGFALKITDLGVALAGTSSSGCSGAQNFTVTQIPAARYPITLPAAQTRTLGQLGVADADKPRVEMLNQPYNQDACKGVSIDFDYSGSAGK